MQFFLPMNPPRTTHQQKKIRIVRGRPIFYEGPKLRAARAKLTAALRPHKPDEPMQGPLHVIVEWSFETKNQKQDNTYKTTRPDIDNLNKLLFDIMTDLGYWQDDAQIVREGAGKFWSMTPGIFISVEEIDEKGERAK
jgi:Holliday junction resolvase RusA-like endonuclease